MKAIILGVKGTLGSVLEERLSKKDNTTCVGYDQDNLDATKFDLLEKMIQEQKPDVLFNCIAYNAVDAAETEEGKEIAFMLNADIPKELARLSKVYNFTLIHYSTGYVFDGDSDTGYSEDAQTNPISVYGQSKLLGEENVIKNSEKYYLIRLNWLYGRASSTSAVSKKSFPEIVLELATKYSSGEGTVPKFVSDEFSSPTYALDLAEASIDLFQSNYPYGIYHPDSQEKASWYEFAEEVLKLNDLQVNIEEIKSADLPRAAKRPKNSLLLNTKYKNIRGWRKALSEYYNK